MIEKKCKECGKIFLAKSARQVYCSGDHYRPCPVCGEPVLIKYLSDPTPKCEKCKKNRSSAPKEEPVTSSVLAKVEQKASEEPKKAELKEAAVKQSAKKSVAFTNAGNWIYVGNPYKNGFIPGHEYEIRIAKAEYVYEVSSYRDVTDDKPVDIMIPFSSKVSIDRNFSKMISR